MGVRGRGVCVPGETKALNTSTRLGVGRPAVEKLASPQQAPGRLHVETWAGLLQTQNLQFSQETEIMSECALVMACPSCPDHSPEPPGPGRVVRNMLSWSQLEKSVWSGVWLFRCAPPRGESFFFP